MSLSLKNISITQQQRAQSARFLATSTCARSFNNTALLWAQRRLHRQKIPLTPKKKPRPSKSIRRLWRLVKALDIDRIIPLGAELPSIEELSVKISAHCTTRQFDKRSLPTEFLTQEEVCPVRIEFSLWPVEEEAEGKRR